MIYLDANFFIYAVEGNDAVAEPVRRLLLWLRQHSLKAVTSELTLAEVLAPPVRKGALLLRVKRRLYLDLIVWSQLIDLKPVSRDVLYETADLRNISNMKLPDAIHVVTAVHSNCRYFMSQDRRVKTPRGIRVVRPDQGGVSKVMKELV